MESLSAALQRAQQETAQLQQQLEEARSAASQAPATAAARQMQYSLAVLPSAIKAAEQHKPHVRCALDMKCKTLYHILLGCMLQGISLDFIYLCAQVGDAKWLLCGVV